MAAPSCGKCIKARPGQRVVRGPDWWGGDEDGGIDHVGTVVSVFEPETGIGYASHPIQVKWDAGPLQCYRACCTSGTCDLRLIDAGPSGVTFLNITCCYCETKGVTGTLWKCAECADYNLCHPCYMMDKHNVEHEFFRYDDTSSKGFRVPARKKSTKVPFYGIFLGAEVQSHGAVKNDIVANVRGKARLLRKTDDGKLYYNNSDKVDESLKYIKKACGGNYYRDHMPAIGALYSAYDLKLVVIVCWGPGQSGIAQNEAAGRSAAAAALRSSKDINEIPCQDLKPFVIRNLRDNWQQEWGR